MKNRVIVYDEESCKGVEHTEATNLLNGPKDYYFRIKIEPLIFGLGNYFWHVYYFTTTFLLSSILMISISCF